MEPLLGRDLARVRLHQGPTALATANALDAPAYTVGRHVVFGRSAFALTTRRGAWLLAHELVHSVQQGVAEPRDVSCLRIGARDAAGERAAERAADRAMHGGATATRVQSGSGGLIQRAEHGTYVSRGGPAAFLDAAFNFYRTWGYPNVQRVSNMQEVLTDLDRARGTLDTFRIVAHANAGGFLELGFLPGLSPQEFDTETVQFTSEQPFRERVAAEEILAQGVLANLVGRLRANAATGPLLTAIGVGADLPAEASPLGILLRAILERQFLRDLRLPNGGAPVIPGVLAGLATRRLDAYREAVVNSVPRADQPALRQAIAQLIAQIPAALVASGWVFAPMDQADIDAMAVPIRAPGAGPARLRPDLAVSIREGATGPYLRLLRSVQGKVDTGTHVQIRGCEVGQNPDFLEQMRAFFGRPDHLPSITAPDLFQYYFQLSFATFPGGPAGDAAVTAAWNDPAIGLPESFEDSRRIRAGEMIRVADERVPSLEDVARRYGHDPALIRTLNPQILDPTMLRGGDIVWLKAPGIRAGTNTSLSDICATVLGNEHLWPRIWSYNPQIQDAGHLSPADWIWLVSPEIRQRAGQISMPPTIDEFRATMARGEAFVGVDRQANRPTARMAEATKAGSVAAWLARQNFDPRGRTAVELSRLYAGRSFGPAMRQTFVSFLSRSFPQVEDPIWQDDPRFPSHIIRRP